MRTFFEQLERLKGQPHHVRKQVAFVTAGAGAALVGLFWFGGSLVSGAYAIPNTNFAQNTSGASLETTRPGGSSSQYAGAAAALGNTSDANKAHIEIVDAPSSTPSTTQAEPTIIPF